MTSNKKGIEYLASPTKRRLDVLGGIACATMLAPLAVAVGTAAAIDTRSANPLFLQERSGGVQDKILAYKFRTLTKNMGSYATTQTFGTFDPRASSLGQYLRQSGLDEIPQVLNVLQGDMSLVGPRPLTDEDINRYAQVDQKLFDVWYPIYRQSRPGLTGESQIFRHHYRVTNDEMIHDSMQMDIAYGQQASVASDLRWLARTPIGLLRANIGVEETLAV
jgi:lipopolysaccharide/colanic/teichoic acid biosynthesis glycosyltransferase